MWVGIATLVPRSRRADPSGSSARKWLWALPYEIGGAVVAGDEKKVLKIGLRKRIMLSTGAKFGGSAKTEQAR
jgi:hypothetical protein